MKVDFQNMDYDIRLSHNGSLKEVFVKRSEFASLQEFLNSPQL